MKLFFRLALLTFVLSSCSVQRKQIVLFGDSIVEQGLWAEELKQIVDYEIVVNGKSGCSVAYRDSNSLVRRIKDVPKTDYLVVMGGNNDYIYEMEIGEFDDATYPDTTFYGALHRIIQYRMTNNPECKIVLCTPLHCAFALDGFKSSYDAIVTNDRIVQPETTNGYKLVDYVSAIHRIGEFYSVPVCDFYSSSNICPFVPANSAYNTQDGIHPTSNGGRRMAQLLKTYFQE